MDDFSIDLETLGTRYNAPILSIGVAQFSRETGEIGATFYKEVDIESALRVGKPSADTIAWWITQNKQAQAVFHGKDKMALSTVLMELTTWMRSKSFAPCVWGNGATFDISILEYAYDHGTVGLKEPWHFMKIRDMRTIVEAAEMLFGFDRTFIPKVGVAHNALDDATYQAKIISAAWTSMRKNTPSAAKTAKKTEQVEVEEEL